MVGHLVGMEREKNTLVQQLLFQMFLLSFFLNTKYSLIYI